MRYLLSFILLLIAAAGNAAPVVGTALTTNRATFTSPAAGEIPKIHSVSSGMIVWTNAVDGGAGSGQPASDNLTNWSSVATNQFARTNDVLWERGSHASSIRRKSGNNIIGPNAEGSIIGSGTNNTVSNIYAVVFGNRNYSKGDVDNEEGGMFVMAHDSYVRTVTGLDSSGGGIFGGSFNTNVWSDKSVIAGGELNLLGVTVVNALAGDSITSLDNFIGGGTMNAITNASLYSFIGGGSNNTIKRFFQAPDVTYGNWIGGGTLNTISNANYSSILGPGSNQIIGASRAMIVGEQITNTTANTLDLGMHNTSKVTISETETTFRSNVVVSAPVEINTAANPNTNSFQVRTNSAATFHFLVRSNGNVGLGVNVPTEKLHLASGSVKVGNTLYSDNAIDFGDSGTIDDVTGVITLSALDVTGESTFQQPISIAGPGAPPSRAEFYTTNDPPSFHSAFEGPKNLTNNMTWLMPTNPPAADTTNLAIVAITSGANGVTNQIGYVAGGTGSGGTGTNFASVGITNFFRFFAQTNSLAGAGTTNLIIDGNQAALVRCTVGAAFGILWTNLIDGQEGRIEVKQDSTGIRTGSTPYGAGPQGSGGGAFTNTYFGTDITFPLTFSTNASYVDEIKWVCRGTNAIIVGFLRGYPAP